MSTISDNPSYTDIQNQIIGLKNILNLLPISNKDEMLNKISVFEEQIRSVRFEPDKFNQYYSELGWIAYESMNFDLMKNAIKLGEDNNTKEGEQLLIKYYTTNENIQYLLMRLRNRSGFKNRYDLLLKAYEDFQNKRYHSCIPVFLMIIDGVVDEVTKSNKGFFASDFNPKLWNSIVGHESGLSKIAKIYAKTRKKANTSPIYLPYRNGILHGKDISYDNVFVATKCLATIFAVGDWVEQYESGKHVKPKPSKPKTILQQLNEFKESLVSLQKLHEKTEKEKAEIEKWKPRQISEEYIGNINLKINGCVNDNPEDKLSEFMTFFQKKNYGNLHDIILRYHDKSSKGQYIKTIKSYIGNLSLLNYKIISIEDCAPAISEIEVMLDIIDNFNEKSTIKTKCRLIYQKDAFTTSALVRGNPEGQWFILNTFINEIHNQYWRAKISS